MLVVADSSPLIVLVNIDLIDILPKLFTKVAIPPEVAAELRQPNRPTAVRRYIDSPPPWLFQCAPQFIEPIPLLHEGERAAISLARELNAELLLIDESQGRKAAAERNIRFAGTVGVLELAATKGLIDLADAFHKIKQTDFWISHDLLDERLKLHRSKPNPSSTSSS